MRERWWRWVQWAGGLLVLGFVARFLIRNWATIRAEPVAWRLAPGWILASLATILVTYALLSESWRRMLQGFGPRLRWIDAARIWVLSSMGKYLPGKVWAIAGMAVLAQRRGVPAWSATGSAILLQVVSIGTGALLVGLTGMASLEAHRPGSRIALVVIMLGSVAALLLVSWAPLTRRLLARLAIAPETRATPSAPALGFGLAANLAAWILYGCALWLLARGILPAAELPLPEAVGAFAGSYIAGLLFLLAPGGLGVREGVFMWMLQDRLGPANALALAAVSRLGMTVADVLAALPFVLTRRGAAGETA
ncbi:MAG TPA: lysylphosphatidylglycerol synthase transmembrane domain-containing protein [Gemmatimonadales bacterium]|nr:lysylphosphatidylglycerol synthase transmembrane domain-containing protein [Gemmatimonadales bacterium]